MLDADRRRLQPHVTVWLLRGSISATPDGAGVLVMMVMEAVSAGSRQAVGAGSWQAVGACVLRHARGVSARRQSSVCVTDSDSGR